MSISLAVVTTDCDDPQRVAAFWSKALELPIDEGASEFFVSLGTTDPNVNPKMFFIKVPEAKTVKNRMHVDLLTDDEDADTERLLALGATRVEKRNEWGHTWTVFSDPENNEFCMSGPHHSAS